ncbi:MAG: hypothetical protein EOO10_23190 [Chitinophagaceae bacterium]|nr:MAG: hypothetical protein EOO10_23190 [Chitinophagaceae bacterium]
MKLKTVLKLAIIFHLLFAIRISAQEPKAIDDFKIVINATDKETKLECNTGCNWNELTFNSNESALDEN